MSWSGGTNHNTAGKRRPAAVVVLALVLSACEGTPTPAPPQLSTLPGMAVTATLPATSAPIAEVTVLPSETPALLATPTSLVQGPQLGPEASFWAGDVHPVDHFTPNPNPVFPADTRSVSAWIPYHNMMPGMPIRRDWFRNGQLWLSVQDTWRGSMGNGVTRVLLDGQQAALVPGDYELRLYVEDVPQPTASGTPHRFRIEPAADSLASTWPPDYRGIQVPDVEGIRLALVEDWGTLIVQYANGQRQVIADANWITGIVWFPDGQHLIFQDQLPESTVTGAGLPASQLYAADIRTGIVTVIGRADEYFRNPAISEDGALILVEGGSGYAEDCLTDESLGIIRVDGDMNRIEMLTLTSFAGVPAYDAGGLNVLSSPHWVGPGSFQVELFFDCLASPNNGIYQFDISVRHASLIQPNPGEAGESVSPGFTEIVFTEDPSAPDAPRQATFPSGVARVYALIGYRNMHEGLIVRREWYRDGALWLEREEPWDFDRYGVRGIMQDVSIFSQGGGLPPAIYELRLYIDGVPQFSHFTGFDLRSFQVIPTP